MDISQLTQLGNASEIPESPDKAVIEVVDNPYSEFDYSCRFTCPEMTSLCPRTGQPDFATLVIDYQPNKYLIESKSLKLFIASFRNHKSFHEVCTTIVCEKLFMAAKPRWMRVAGFWNPRGGIPIDVIVERGDPFVDPLPLDMPAYRAR